MISLLLDYVQVPFLRKWKGGIGRGMKDKVRDQELLTTYVHAYPGSLILQHHLTWACRLHWQMAIQWATHIPARHRRLPSRPSVASHQVKTSSRWL